MQQDEHRFEDEEEVGADLPRLRLIPLDPADEDPAHPVRLEELLTPVVRESKHEVFGPDLRPQDLAFLEERLSQLDGLLAERNLEQADALAETCLARVIRFPDHRSWIQRIPVRTLLWGLGIGALVGGLCMLA